MSQWPHGDYFNPFLKIHLILSEKKKVCRRFSVLFLALLLHSCSKRVLSVPAAWPGSATSPSFGYGWEDAHPILVSKVRARDFWKGLQAHGRAERTRWPGGRVMCHQCEKVLFICARVYVCGMMLMWKKKCIFVCACEGAWEELGNATWYPGINPGPETRTTVEKPVKSRRSLEFHQQ